MTSPTAQEILATPMQENDANATTIGGYLACLSAAVWQKEEGFSGKRPFGNSGWDHDVIRALITAKHVKGSLDADGYIVSYDGTEIHNTLITAFDLLKNADYTALALPPAPEDWYVLRLSATPFETPVIYDYLSGGSTEEEAKERAAEWNRDIGNHEPSWRAIHIPKVS